MGLELQAVACCDTTNNINTNCDEHDCAETDRKHGFSVGMSVFIVDAKKQRCYSMPRIT